MNWKRFGEKFTKRWRDSRRERRRRKGRSGLRDLFVTLLVAFVLVFGVVRPFIVAAYWVPTESMVPTLLVGDRVFANKFIYRFAEPERGDIVVFEDVEGGEDDLIKRVVAVAGDRVRVNPTSNPSSRMGASTARRGYPKGTCSLWETTGATQPTRAPSVSCRWRT